MENTILLILDIYLATNHSFHTTRYTIILQNRVGQKSGKYIFLHCIDLVYNSPTNPHELFNLYYATTHNVIEYIFRVIKWQFQFWILLLVPKYSLAIQVK